MMLYSHDYFSATDQSIVLEPRLPQVVFPEHAHDFYELFIVTQGRGHHIFNDRLHTLYPGMVCYIQAHDVHQFEHVEDLHITNVLYRSPGDFHILSNISHLLPGMREHERHSHWWLDSFCFNKAIHILNEFSCQNCPNPVYDESLFLQLLIHLQQGRYCCTGQGSNEQRIIQLLRWLDVHYLDEIDWSGLTEQFAISLRTFHRYMRNHLGVSPQNYLITLRLSHAYDLIRFTDKTVTEIAMDCGFNDSAYFSTRFKSEFKLTPRMLRDCIG